MDACRSSGLSIRKWCEVYQVHCSQFYYWWKKFNGVEKQLYC
ncbi:MAG: IS66 family insertion sequence element accessory protein TnpA [Bacillaceae bacterium]